MIKVRVFLIAFSGLLFSLMAEAGSRAAHPEFALAYKKVEKLLKKDDLEGAGKAFSDMASYRANKGFPEYEEAHFQLLGYRLNQELGNTSQSRSYLEGLALEGAGYIESDIYAPAAMSLLKLQLQDKSYAELQRTVQEMQKDKQAKKQVESIAEILAKVDALIQGSQPVLIDAVMPAAGHWQRILIRPALYLDNVSGEVTGYDLNCKKKQISLPHDPEGSIQIPDSWGECIFVVKGTEGASFTLVQVKP